MQTYSTAARCRAGLAAVALFLTIGLPLLSAAHARAEEASLPYGPGTARIEIADARTDRPLSGRVWYPTATPEVHQPLGTSKVWQMPDADPEAAPAKGVFPLLVVSHGTYGNTRNQAWLGSALSRRGFIVAMVDHPGTSTFLRDPDQARQLWDRPVDLSRLITWLLEASELGDRIDRKRIYAAGHSLGGFTVAVLGGARFDSRRYRSICSEAGLKKVCAVFSGWSVSETKEDSAAMEVSRKDPRVTRIVSLDLGGTEVLSPKSLEDFDVPVLVFGAERGDMVDQNLESRALAAALPASRVRHVELADGGHFDFMGRCKPEGYELLKVHEPGDEMVCVKGTEEREAQHRRILDEMIDFLQD
ncbi:alpha/beta hydrolase family protein [Roseibium aggregatum]|uniref:Prolyl oligopeptidase family serine peptidase n=1 Tax=Roseibium aggregatum TaxID=187304 RepID=A0A939J2Y2_9HYPH|nr:prolyl oligopeptidase family serine peptidase [Roseibium aggregatum]MBN9670017.1 prolyl oligopeptidase family serine peptidase [Roseibium aggregatum]